MNRTQHSIQNFFWGFCYRVLHMMFPVLLRAIIIRKIGAAYIGLNGLFKSILSVLSLSELGFGSAIVYMMYKPITEGDKTTVRALLSLLRRVYCMVGLIMLALGLLAIPFLRFLVKNDTGTDINIYILYGMYLFHTVMSYWMFSYKSALFTAYQQSAINFKILFFCGIAEYGLQIFILFMTGNYYLYLLVFALMIIPQNLLYQIISKRKYPDLYCEGEPTKEQIHIITSKIKALFGHRLGGTIIVSIDNVIISAFLGITILLKYDNYNYIMDSIVTLVAMLGTSIAASIGHKLNLDSLNNVYAFFKRMTFLWIGMIGWCTACLICLYQPFITIWVGQEYLFHERFVLCMGLYFFAWKFRHLNLIIKDAAGLWEQDKWKPYIGMTVNLVFSILFVKITGSIFGVMFPTIFVFFIVYYPWEIRVLFDKLFKRSSKEYVKLSLRFLLTVFAAVGLTYVVCRVIPLEGILCMAVRGLICTVIMPFIYTILNINTQQLQETIKMVNNMVSKYEINCKILRKSNS